MNSRDDNAAGRIVAECTECGICNDECQFLGESGVSPAEMIGRGVETSEAFSCLLCGLCQAVCPAGLQPAGVFARCRVQAMENGEIDPREQGCFLPDENDSIMEWYREYYEIDYSDIDCCHPDYRCREGDEKSETAFFPGCTLLTYAPGLVRKACEQLRQQSGCRGIITECCGKPLDQLGLSGRARDLGSRLIEKLKQIRIKRLVAACPGCYYYLREELAGCGVEIATIYEALAFEAGQAASQITGQIAGQALCTVHDSCPDRFEGIFAHQVRVALQQAGYRLTEMESNRLYAPCCGSGGQISHFRPDLAEELVVKRLQEARATGTDFLAACCQSCVLNLSRQPSKPVVRHVLNLLLDYDEDYSDVKKRVAAMFAESEKE